MTNNIFCPNCNTLILDAPRCKCGWERPPAKATERGKLAWKISLGAGEPSGLRVTDGVLYFVDGAGNLRALAAGSGEDNWPEPPSLGEWRVHNQVAVGGGLVVVGPVDNASIPSADKAVIAFELENGRERWRRPLDVRQISDPLISQDAVFVATSDGYGVALDLSDGSVLWREPIGGIYFAAPALAADLILFGSDKGILMARRKEDGKLAWRFEAEDYGRWQKEFRYPATVVDGIAYVTCWNRRCYALDAAGGEVQWISEPTRKRPPMTPPLVADDAIFFAAHDRYIYSLDRASGEQRWATQLPKFAQVSPALIDSVLYIAAGDRNLYALDPATGEQIGDPILKISGKIEHAWACDGHTLYMADSKGRLYGLTVHTPEVMTDAAVLEEQGLWVEAAAQHALAGERLRAAEIYRAKLQQPNLAAQLYEKGGELMLAAEQYQAADKLDEARNLYRELDQPNRVADISVKLGDLLTAAQASYEAGNLGQAGEYYYELGKQPQAATLFEQAAEQAEKLKDFESARRWRERAARLYEDIGQSEKAVKLYQQAGHAKDALRLFPLLKGLQVEAVIGRILYNGSLEYARSLEGDGRYISAAEEYIRAEQPADAARMYEAAQEYALAIEQYRLAGQILDAARMMEISDNCEGAALLYLEADENRRAANAFAHAKAHKYAARNYEVVQEWALAAEQWEKIGVWEHAAQAWEKAGNLERAATAWENEGDILRAAEDYWQIAHQIHQQETSPKDREAAPFYEQAMKLFAACGATPRAQDCDIQYRFLLKLPVLKVDALKLDQFSEGKSGKLTVVVQNIGWGYARDISISAEGDFTTDLTTVPDDFGLAPDIPGESSWYIRPQYSGTLPLHLQVTYCNGRGDEMPPLKHTIEIQVQEKRSGSGVTPSGGINVQGNWIQVETAQDVVTGDQVKIQRQSATPPAESSAAPEDEIPVPTITCENCGEEQPATAFKCSNCQVPF